LSGRRFGWKLNSFSWNFPCIKSPGHHFVVNAPDQGQPMPDCLGLQSSNLYKLLTTVFAKSPELEAARSSRALPTIRKLRSCTLLQWQLLFLFGAVLAN
jgi:hypothetical protein